jgi:chromosome segregation ATPase
MAGSTDSALNRAIEAMDRAYATLEAAVEDAAQRRQGTAAQAEAVQLELTTSWQQHSAGLETQVAELQSQNDFLKEDNLRLANQLQQLQRDYLELQSTAGHAVHRLDGAVKQLDLILEH